MGSGEGEEEGPRADCQKENKGVGAFVNLPSPPQGPSDLNGEFSVLANVCVGVWGVWGGGAGVKP